MNKLRFGGTDNNSGYVYFLENTVTGNIKIGISKNVMERVKALQAATDCELVLRRVLRSWDMESYEIELHEAFADSKIRGEWFRPTRALKDLIENKALE